MDDFVNPQERVAEGSFCPNAGKLPKTPLSRHDDQISYYAAFNAHPEAVPGKLREATVAVVGAGGIGSEVIRHLAAAGVGAIIAIDHDMVSLANLNRQHWFGPSDVGRPKTECIADQMRWFAPQTSFAGVQRYINNLHTLIESVSEAIKPKMLDCSFIACCADTPVGEIELAALAASWHFGCPVGACGMNLRRGYWTVITNPVAKTNATRFFEQVSRTARARNATTVSGSASWTNAVISAFFAEAIVSEVAGLAGCDGNALLAFDFDRMASERTMDFMQAA
ncbi:ThiF family adenylyltransferase [Rhizobium ruizarguesonis]